MNKKNNRIVSILQAVKKNENNRYTKSILYVVRRDGFRLEILLRNLGIRSK